MPSSPSSDTPDGDTPDSDTLGHKVFGLGLARTGTTSLHHAMGVLGLNSAPDSVALLDRIDVDFLARHDAFFDNPIPFRFRELDQVCHSSSWIVTQRPLEAWLTSMRWLFGPGLDRLEPGVREVGDHVHRTLYGTDQYDESRLVAIYHEHYDDVASWVQGRDMIWLHLDQGFDWEPICELLDLPVPATPFPHSNKALDSKRSWFTKRRG